MPIYEYRCEECGENFDKFLRSIFAKVEITCPACGSLQVRKGFSTFASRGNSSSTSVPMASDCAPSG